MNLPNVWVSYPVPQTVQELQDSISDLVYQQGVPSALQEQYTQALSENEPMEQE